MSNGAPEGSKLIAYMNRQPHTQGFNPNTAFTPSDPINGVSGGMKKMSLASQEFVPSSNSGAARTASPAFGSHFNPGGMGMRSNGAGGGATSPSAGQGSSRLSPRQPSPTPTPNAAGDMMGAGTSGAMAVPDISSFNEGGTTYFYNSDEMPVNASNTMSNGGESVLLPDFQSYAGTPSYVSCMKVKANTPAFMAENELKMEILKRQLVSMAQVDPESHPNLPTEVDNFTNLCPLEPPPVNPMHKSQTFGYTTSVYKATNMKSGLHVCLRRIHGYRLVNTKCMMIVEQWKKLSHSNLVSLRQVFTTKSFGDHSMVFVYDFFPCAETLMSKHFNSPSQVGSTFLDPFAGGDGARPYSQQKNQILRQQAMLTQNGLLPESLIWTYVIQLTAALRHIHSAGLACRTLDPTKILVINKTRLLLNCSGIFDVLTFDPSAANPMSPMAHYQQEDLIALGKIVLALACNSFLAIQRENLQTSMEIVASTYSGDLRNLIMYLLTNPTRVKSVNDLMPMIGARFYIQLDSAYNRSDMIEAELSKEIESSRLFRLLTKLCTVVDRAELNGDFGWAEYGDRYMLKLFRDYVFHQVMEDSRPWLDMAHVISCLNRLDAGSPEKVCLMSRDEQNVLVVSYAELKNCLEQSFAECVHSQRHMPTGMAGGAGY